jgi:hypothetical protein
MVLITPRLVRPLDPDEVPPLPTRQDQFLQPEGIVDGVQGGAGASTPRPFLNERERICTQPASISRRKGCDDCSSGSCEHRISRIDGLAVDYGIKLIARTEAQRAADAGALAGAISLAFDGSADLTESGIAKRSAHGFALANSVFGEAPDVNITSDINFIECPEPDGGPGTTCIRVDVPQSGARQHVAHVFSRLIVCRPGVQATATQRFSTRIRPTA